MNIYELQFPYDTSIQYDFQEVPLHTLKCTRDKYKNRRKRKKNPSHMIEDNSSLSEISESDEKSISFKDISDDSDDSELIKSHNWNSDGEYIGPKPISGIVPPPRKIIKTNKELEQIYQHKENGDIVFIHWNSLQAKLNKSTDQRKVYNENGILINDSDWYSKPLKEKNGQYIRMDKKPPFKITDLNKVHSNKSDLNKLGLNKINNSLSQNINHYDSDNDLPYYQRICIWLIYLIAILIFLSFIILYFCSDQNISYFTGLMVMILIIIIPTAFVIYNFIKCIINSKYRKETIDLYRSNCLNCIADFEIFIYIHGNCCANVCKVIFYLLLFSIFIFCSIMFSIPQHNEYNIHFMIGMIVSGIFASISCIYWIIKYIIKIKNPIWRKNCKTNCKECCDTTGLCLAFCCINCLTCEKI